MTTASLARAAALALVLACAPAAQVRDGGAEVSSGIIAGTLVAADTGAPVRGARIMLRGTDEPVGIVITDDLGAFVFDRVPAGKYTLSAVRSGFISVSYGEKRPGYGGRGAPIVVGGLEPLDRLTFTMPRGGVITGNVRDAFGEPAIGAGIRVYQIAVVAGRRTLLPAGIAEVDDRGEYRVYPLPPGEFVIAALGSTGAARGEAFQAGALAALLLRNPNAGGLPTPAPLTAVPEIRGGSKFGYLPAFYPGVASVASAMPVPLALSEVKSGIDLRLQPQPFSHVAGVVRGPNGVVGRVQVQLREVVPPGTIDYPQHAVRQAITDNSGRFSFDALGGGEYTVEVRVPPTPGSDSSLPMWARQHVSVGAGTHADGLELVLDVGISVSGTVLADGGDVSRMATNITFTPAGDSRFLADVIGRQDKPVGSNGRFVAAGLLPGQYELGLQPEIPGWRLASAMFGGRDALDFLLDVRPGELPVGVVTLGRETELSGRLTNEKGQPVADMTVVVFSTDERFWLPGNRRNQAAASQDGRYAFENLPPGTYRLAVLDDYDALAGPHAGLFRELTGAGTVLVTLADGERKVQDLRIR